jgi:diguanylate cyclase (GGDEF)-like protein/PAS domain S-box-containing protein
MMITDSGGIIQKINEAFTRCTGYTSEEAVGQTPRLLKSGHHDADFYRTMWDSIQRTGTWRGEIWDRRKNGEIYPQWLTVSAVRGDDGVVTHYVGAHLDITARKAAENKIQQLAFHDPLTRLPNRLLLLDRLQHALATNARNGHNGALLFIDLDNFKTLNDTLGHVMGDQLLQHVAERLNFCVREGDTVARFGGDEFVVMLENLSDETIEAAEQAEEIGEKILAALHQPYRLDAHDFRSSASIGATVFNEARQGAEELLKQADIAMYQAKKAGRNALRFFDPQMQETINLRIALENDLHKAIRKNEFLLYYQVQVNHTFRPVGVETLIRWNHPERGLVPPAQFIPLAEETGLIQSIGLWMLNTGCAQLKAWERDEKSRSLVLAINVSAKQFHQPDFVAQVGAAVQHHAIDPRLLKLELTESLLLEDTRDNIATMKALKAIGIQLSLDDFGTGYSSLQYIKLLPLDQIKIDQSFVRDITTDPNDAAIVQAIIAMASALDLQVMAEGVETEAQRDFLQSRGCHAYQGYLFGEPLNIEQFEATLEHNEPD